jgi:hypothetical protein
MQKRWPILVGIAVVGAFSGVAIAGHGDRVNTFVMAPAVETASSDESSLPPATIVAPSTSPVTSPPSTASPATTAPAATTTEAPASTAAPPPPPTTADAGNGTLARGDVRVVIANGDGRFNLAGANANRLRDLGYVDIDQEDAAHVDATVLYYRPGFDDEAAIMAADLLVPNAILQPLPDTPVTASDDAGDIVVVLGPDAVR